MSDYKEVPFPFPKGPIKTNRKYLYYLSFFCLFVMIPLNRDDLYKIISSYNFNLFFLFVFMTSVAFGQHIYMIFMYVEANYKWHKKLQPWIKNQSIKNYVILVNKENRLLTIYEVQKLIQYGKDVDCFLAYQTISELSD